MSDAELNKAALLIAKLLLRTREGKIQWNNASNLLSSNAVEGFILVYKADLDDGLEAQLTRDNKGLGFKLCGPPAVDLPTHSLLSPMLGGRDTNEIVAIQLDHLFDKTGLESPESIVYRDLAELVFLAENPKSVSDDLRYLQALTYLDKLSA